MAAMINAPGIINEKARRIVRPGGLTVSDD
jgi:hypothetical protein